MQKEIQKWIEKFVSKPNKLLNGFPPCPYARTALIKYVETDHINMLFDIMLEWNDDVENVNGVKMNFGKCIIILVQRLSKINEASHVLKEKGYYDVWSKENLDDVVNWRE